MKKVIIKVVKSIGFPNYGYSLSHNQEVGFKGIEGTAWGWYKYKRDALEAAKKLQEEWNQQ